VKIRIKDIAQRANVSSGTVDRVLHNRGEVSEDTRFKIMSIVNEFNYQPDIVARTLASKRIFKIGILMPDPNSGISYWQAPINGINLALSEVSHYGIEACNFYFDFFSKQSYKDSALKLLAQSPDAIITAPIFADQASTLLSHCKEKSIPVVFIDSMSNNLEPNGFIGQNAFQSGRVAASLLNFGIKENGNVLVISITNEKDNTSHFQNRVDGFKSYFAEKKHTYINIDYIQISEFDELSIANALDKKIKPELNGIFIPNSRAFKVVNYLTKNNIEGKKIIGYDLIDKNVSYLRAGKIDFLISQRPEEQGINAIHCLTKKMVMGRDIEKIHFLPIDIITKENIDFY
jgi:LacI family transcriptional regulator